MQALEGIRKQTKLSVLSRRPFRQERLDAICQQLSENGYVSVAELSERGGVSAATIRSDLELLEQNGRLQRTHGGAVPFHLSDGALSFAVRQRENIAAKERIGGLAAEYVSDGEAIVLDASTTAWQMARHLIARRDLTVITTGLFVALELLRAPGVSVIIPGGAVWREAASVVGPISTKILESGNLQQGFFSGRGLSINEGLTDANQAEVELKRQLILAVRQVNVIVDASKLGRVAFASCATISQIKRLFTDNSASSEMVSSLRERGIDVILA
ncbi:MAG: DeoR/GlpR family DNA-binding transcription regulator [Anaerolineae bacterium]